MSLRSPASRLIVLVLVMMAALTACNLGAEPPTSTPTATSTITATTTSTVVIPTNIPPTALVLTQSFPTSVVLLPPTVIATNPPPANPPVNAPVRIVMYSPGPGNTVAGAVQVIGASVHPQFLQYQLTYGPDPNPGNLWYPIAASTIPIYDGLLGVWNTTGNPDGIYQLRLQVYLNNGTSLTTAINNIRVQNQQPTPRPTSTPQTPRPIAAFAQSPSTGAAPLTVQFYNQSAGNINAQAWSFGDGQTSGDGSPSHTFNSPGLYNVTLTIQGPGGVSNVSSQIYVQSRQAPVAGFKVDKSSGTTPLQVKFTDATVGTVSNYTWTFGDGSGSSDRNPIHTFRGVGTYNVILTVSGPSGASSVTRQITVQNPAVAAPKASFVPNPLSGNAPLAVAFANLSTGSITSYSWNFGDGTVSTDQNPSHVYAGVGIYQVTLIATGPGGQSSSTTSITVRGATATPTLSSTPVPPLQLTSTPTATLTETGTSTATSTATATPTATATVTPTNTGTVTPAPTITPTDTPSSTSTATPTPTTTITPSPTVTLIVLSSLTPTNTTAPTITPTDTATATATFIIAPTFTPVPPTSTSTSTATNTSVPPTFTSTSTATNTSVPPTWTPTSTASSTSLPPPSDTPTSTPTDTAAPTITPTSTDTVVPTWTPTNTAVPTLTPTNTEIPSLTPTDTVVPSWTPSDTPIPPPTDTPTFTPTNTELPSVTPTDTEMPTLTPTNTDTVVPTWTPSNTPTDTEVPTATPTNTEIPTLTPTNTEVPPTATPTNLPPVVAFTANPSTGPAPLAVQFTNTTSGDIAGYTWDFGDGGSSTETSPSHIYAAPGAYTVTLSATATDGQFASAQSSITVLAPPPVVAFVPDQMIGNAPLTVQFTNNTTGNIASYAWDFGDGGASADLNPSHTFAAPGSYTVTLTATATDGQFGSAQVVITVQAPAPVVSFSANPTSGTAPLTVQFTNSSTGQIASYVWDFGDGGTSADTNPLHIYVSAGTYTVTLTATATDGQAGSAQVTITVTAPPPVASFTANPTTGDAPLVVQFTNASTGDLAGFAWDFGDASSSTDVSPSHTYAAPGTYTVTLTATGKDGQAGSAQGTITVSNPPPTVAFGFSPTSGDAPLTVQFANQTTGDAVSYAWDFGDGGASADQNPQHIYQAAGTFTVTLTATSSTGVQSSASQTITVTAPPTATVPPPAVSFVANPTQGDAPLTVQFTNATTGDAVSYAWDFGDGQSSADANPSHTYAAAGTFTVTLTATSSTGVQASSTGTITVNAPAPVVDFSFDPATGPAPLAVQFTNATTGDAVSFTWNFGDDATSTETSPSHVFAAPGTYTVTLTATGSTGQTASATKTVTVTTAAPQAAFTADPTQGDAPLTVQFANTTAGDGLTFTWDFGDGQGSSDANPSHMYVAPGTYVVTLTATAGDGQSGAAQATITVNLPPPSDTPAPTVVPLQAAFSANPTQGGAPLAVQFTNATTGDAAGYTWDFGDGGTSADQNPSYTYNAPGTYTVTLTANGPNGETSQSQGQIVVTAAAPQAAFTANPTSGTAPLDVTFTNATTGDVTGYAWDFGDGETSTDPNPTHTYKAAGNYTITLNASGANGETSSATGTVTVGQEVAKAPAPLVTLQGHTDRVNAVAWSPDGGRVATGSNDNNVIVWDANSGQAIITLSGHTKAVTSVAWSPDGGRIAAGSDDKTVIVWDVASGQQVIALTGADNVKAVAWSPDGGRIASGGDDKNVMVWDVASGQPVITLAGHSKTVNSLAWSPDGARIVGGSSDQTAIVWDVASGQAVFTLQGHSKTINTVAFSRDGGRIATGSDDKTVIVYDAASGQVVTTLQGDSNVNGLSWSADGGRIAGALDGGTTVVWDVGSGQVVATLGGHSGAVNATAYSPDGGKLATSGRDGLTFIWQNP